MNVMGVSLSVWLVLFGLKHTQSQKQNTIIKSAVIADSVSVSNPLP